MKKNILFVIESLNCAGAEKSLVTLLSLLDYSKYNVDLQLFAYGGELQGLVPDSVNILSPLEYTKFSELSLRESFNHAVKKSKLNVLIARLRYSIKIRISKQSNASKARLFWVYTKNVIEKTSKKYDIAISYSQGIPTFYVADKVKADKKIAWVNVGYDLKGKEQKYQDQFYKLYDNIVMVSHVTRDIFLKSFMKYQNKVKVIYDINNHKTINEMAKIGNSYDDNFDGIRILTIGRFVNQKGYDIALEACKELKNRGIKFKWYSLGIGPLEEDIKNYIKDNDLEDNFILLGIRSNPYPYINDCDIYVQTSRFEGFGLAIAEARILNKPVVTTRFDAVYNQMIDKKNGLVVDLNYNSVANGVQEIIINLELKSKIISYLEHEKKGNIEELEKFYNLIEYSNQTAMGE